VSETNETIVATGLVGESLLPKTLVIAATMYTRENLTVLFKCSHGELGRLLSRKMAPLPVRIDGQILWHVDEVQNASAQVLRTLERWKTRR
jgi:hypothetical protein